MQKEKAQESQSPESIIKRWKLNKSVLASKMSMNNYTFKMKLLNKPNYHFTPDEKERMDMVLSSLAGEIISMQSANTAVPDIAQ